jgi:hypothetical protein
VIELTRKECQKNFQ